MKKIVRLTESDITSLVKKIVRENEMMDVSSDSEHYMNRKDEITLPFDDVSMMAMLAKKFCWGKDNLPNCKEVENLIRRHGLNN